MLSIVFLKILSYKFFLISLNHNIQYDTQIVFLDLKNEVIFNS